MVHANTDLIRVRGKIVDAIRDRPAEFLDHEVMYAHLVRLAPRAPLPPGILEVADEFCLVRVDREHWLLLGQRPGYALHTRPRS
jgi:hypothetical protein